jgi:hypothetical protein
MNRGVAILYKSHIKANVLHIPLEDISLNIEFVAAKFQVGFNRSFIVVCVYRHPDYSKNTLKKDQDSLERIFDFLKQTCLNFYVLGDFNLRQSYLAPLIRTLTSLNLNQIVEKPTRNNNLLDLITCSSVESIIAHDLFDPSLSDHSLIHCVTTLKKPKLDKINVSFRPYSNINSDLLQRTLSDH